MWRIRAITTEVFYSPMVSHKEHGRCNENESQDYNNVDKNEKVFLVLIIIHMKIDHADWNHYTY